MEAAVQNDQVTRHDLRSETSIVMVTGAGPGLGKSTLAARLHAHLARMEPRAELFREEDILVHPCFTSVTTEFRSTGQVDRETLVGDARRYLTDLRRRQVPVVVLDALFPYLPSLLAWGHDHEAILQLFGDPSDAGIARHG